MGKASSLPKLRASETSHLSYQEIVAGDIADLTGETQESRSDLMVR